MRFIALLRKELHVVVLLAMLTLIVMLAVGTAVLHYLVDEQEAPTVGVHPPGEAMFRYELFERSLLRDFGPLLLITATALGASIGLYHFCWPELSKTWVFTVHRSVRPRTILLAKATAGGLCLIVAVGLPWTLMFSWAARHGLLIYSPGLRILAEGWVYISMGFAAYLAGAVVGITSAHVYTTRAFALFAGAAILCLLLIQQGAARGLALVAAGCVFLALQLVGEFAKKEF